MLLLLSLIFFLLFVSLFSLFPYFSCFLSFPFGILPLLFHVVVYCAHLWLFILPVVARFTIFTPQLLWACCVCSFKITTLVYRLPNHHHYSVLAVSHFIPRQKWFLFLFSFFPWHSHPDKACVSPLPTSIARI